MKKQSVFERIRDWYYDGNQCEKCPAAQDTTTRNENGTEYDFCCLARHDEMKACRIPRFIRKILARRGRYLMDHEYDGYLEFTVEHERAQEVMEKAIMDHVFRNYGYDYIACWRDMEGTLHEVSTENLIHDGAWDVMDDYDTYQRATAIPLSRQVLDSARNAINRPFKYIWSFIGK